jgi:redox-sensitive bicupin YhaK (pirin superfamily)
MTPRTAARIIAVPVGLQSATITTRDVTRELLGDSIDPFLVASLFEMNGPTFPPHPHAGFAVMTYILPESRNAFLNQDSTGFSNRIAPGGLHMTIAGSGVLHEETVEQDGVIALGFQIWLDLPGDARDQPPRALPLEADEVPSVSVNGATIRVLLGESNGLLSPLVPPTPTRLVDVALTANSTFTQELTATATAFLWMVDGSVIPASDAATPARRHDALVTAPGGTELQVRAGDAGARFLLFSGEPLAQPVLMGGPFVASDRAQQLRQQADFRSGKMGRLEAFGRS